MNKSLLFFFFLVYFPFFLVNAQSDTHLIAKELIREEKYTEATNILRPRIKKYDEDVFHDYFTCLGLEKKHTEAKSVSEKYFRKTKNVLYLVYQSIANGSLQKTTEHNALFDEFIESLSRDGFLISRSAFLYESFGYFEKALFILNKGRVLLGNETLYPFQIIKLLKITAEHEKLIDEYFSLYFNKYIDYNSLEEYLILAVEQNDEKFFSLLEKSLIQKIQNDNSKTEYQKVLMRIYFYKKDYEEAIRNAYSLDSRLETGGQNLYKLVVDFIAIDSIKQAVTLSKRIIQMSPSSVFSYHSRSQMLEISYNTIISGVYSDEFLELTLENYKKGAKEILHTSLKEKIILEYIELLAYHGNKPAYALNVLEELLGQTISGGTKRKALLEKGNILLLVDSVWEAQLIYMQLIKQNRNNVYGEKARYNNARASYFKGDYKWAASQLKILKGKPTSLIANDAVTLSLFLNDNLLFDSSEYMLDIFREVDIQIYKRNYSKALEVLQSIEDTLSGFSIMDDIYFRSGFLNEKLNRFDEALKYYELLFTSYPKEIFTDEAIYRSANIYAIRKKNKKKAEELYQKILFEFSDSIFKEDSRKKLRELFLNE